MATATQAAGAGSNATGVGTIAWSSPGNITSSNSTGATFTQSPGNIRSNYLVSASHGFGIPGGSTINGIELTLRRKATTGNVVDYSINLAKAGVLVGSNKASEIWPSSYANFTYGGAADLWGTTWTVSDINNAGFGAMIVAESIAGSGEVGDVDFVQINVYYTSTLPDAVGSMGNPASAWLRIMRKAR